MTLIDEYLELKQELNSLNTVNYIQKELIEVQHQYIENQEKMIGIYVNRLKEYAKMLEKRETDMHEILDCLIVKDKLQMMQNFIGEIPNRIN